MKNRIFLFTLFCCLVFCQCAHRYKVTYNIPDNYPEAKRDELMATLEKGKILFKTNCSECHGIFTKGKADVTNFTNAQLDNYNSRFLRRDPKNHGVINKMSQEQMNEVLLFLKFKKPRNPDSVKVMPRKRF